MPKPTITAPDDAAALDFILAAGLDAYAQSVADDVAKSALGPQHDYAAAGDAASTAYAAAHAHGEKLLADARRSAADHPPTPDELARQLVTTANGYWPAIQAVLNAIRQDASR